MLGRRRVVGVGFEVLGGCSCDGWEGRGGDGMGGDRKDRLGVLGRLGGGGRCWERRCHDAR